MHQVASPGLPTTSMAFRPSQQPSGLLNSPSTISMASITVSLLHRTFFSSVRPILSSVKTSATLCPLALHPFSYLTHHLPLVLNSACSYMYSNEKGDSDANSYMRRKQRRIREGCSNSPDIAPLYSQPIDGSRTPTDQLAGGKCEVVPQNGVSCDGTECRATERDPRTTEQGPRPAVARHWTCGAQPLTGIGRRSSEITEQLWCLTDDL